MLYLICVFLKFNIYIYREKIKNFSYNQYKDKFNNLYKYKK